MTKNEIKSALNLQGIEFKAKANLATLVGLYNAHCVGEGEPLLQEDGTFPEVEQAPLTQAATELLGNILLTENGLPPVAGTHGAELLQEQFEMSEEERALQTIRPQADPREGDCPGCGIHLSNGLLMRNDEVANKPGVTLHMEGMNKEFHCMGCGHEWGEEVAPYVAPAKPEPIGNGLKIEKDRAEQNGIKRPSIGGKCRAIWDALDEYRAETGELPTSKVVKELAADSGWNPNNASIEYYQWRKFNGISKQA
jgi:hypothetical protein